MSSLETLDLLYTCAKMLLVSVNLILLTVHFQPMWLAKLEPEPILQLEHHLPGHVAAQRQGDLRDHLHQWDHRALEAEVSKSHGWKGAYNIAFWGIFIQSKTAIIQLKMAFLAKYWHFWPIWSHARPINNASKVPRWFFCYVGTKTFASSRKN